MPLRTLRLPTDIPVLAEEIPKAFQYPENEEWSVQADEKESMVDMLNNLRRLWPLVRLLQWVSPALRDIIQGHIWEEDQGIAGVTTFQRLGQTNTWYIGLVAVMPAYRRRGIARQLVQATIESIRERGGKVILLDVIDGNVPAYTLYEKVGFEHFSGITTFNYGRDEPPAELSLPAGYTITPLGFSDWRSRLELAQRIKPAIVQKYEPVEEARFRRPAALRPLMYIIQKASGVREEEIAVHTAVDGEIVARAEYNARVRPGGVNHIWLRVDPEHAELAPYLLQRTIRATLQLSPGRRIELKIAQWQEAGIKAALAAGCTERLTDHRLGLIL